MGRMEPVDVCAGPRILNSFSGSIVARDNLFTRVSLFFSLEEVGMTWSGTV